MCGITGYLGSTYQDLDIKTLLDLLHHRGPDSQGVYKTEGYNAGMTRLMINDLSTGDQPLFNETKDIVLFYNGEIYNHKSLREKLEKKGHKLFSHSDGEVICHLYEEYGEKLFEQLDGMFAIALWDEKKQTLLLARDTPGEKPLYYSQLPNNELIFSSEIKSLQKFPFANFKLNLQAIWDFPTFLWIPEPDTIFENVHAVMPGTYLKVNKQGIEINAYQNTFYEKDVPEDSNDIIKETRKVVEDAVLTRLLSDVPVGSFLSGGLDSSIICSIASREIGNLSTFTIGFEDLSDPYHGRSDESEDAAKFAKEIGTKHHTIRVTAEEFKNNLSDFCKYGDQPFAVSSGLGILSVAAAARETGVKVLLSGDGADECFGGYSWYSHLENTQSSIPPIDENISFQNFGLNLDQRLQAVNSYSPQKKAWAWHYYASENEKSSLFSDKVKNQTKSSLRWFGKYNSSDKWEPRDYVHQDRLFYFPNEMLRKVDRMTMAHSIEGRAPFAAPSVLKFAEKVKLDSMLKEGQLKWSLRMAFADLLPNHIIERPKHGFNVPIDHWLKDEWNDLFQHTFSKDSQLYKLDIIHENSIEVANKMLHDEQRLNGHSLFCMIMLNMWLENYYEEN